MKPLSRHIVRFAVLPVGGLLTWSALVSTAPPPAIDVEWAPVLEDALARAAADSTVVMLALGEVGEGRTERHLASLYGAKSAAAQLGATINVPAWSFDPEEKRDVPRFDGVSAEHHTGNFQAITGRWLSPNDLGAVPVPHHLWLSPKGELLLSCPWELDALELAWCSDEALRRAGVAERPPLPRGAHPPRRLLIGQAHGLVAGDDRGCGFEPLELKDAVSELNKRFLGMSDRDQVTRILFTDEDDAADFIEKQLGLWDMGGRATGAVVELTIGLIGTISTDRFLGLLEAYASDNGAPRRSQVAVALEQFGTADGLKTSKKQFKKEKDPAVRADWARALGASARGDKATAKLLIRAAEKDDSERVRRSAIVALGHVLPEATALEFLHAQVEGGGGAEREAAVLALALGRSVESRAHVADLGEGDIEATTQGAVAAALRVLDGGNLYELEAEIERVTESSIPRPRIFFRATARDRNR